MAAFPIALYTYNNIENLEILAIYICLSIVLRDRPRDPLVLGKRTFARRSDKEEPCRNENEKREIEKNTCVNEN